ncbi:terminase large subunit domain-containing protein [Paenibacillus larvae]|uniref:terminase large subunit domain-containing protein n=1 Tax=Paenibacillus larvae TaxID=1464 RepID=UPI00289A7281|nr:terminase large subunit [Paenibacillus larvae]
MSKHKNYNLVLEYANSVVEGEKVANRETIQMCQRFLNDLDNPAYDFNPKDAEFVIGIIEKTFVHQKGEDMKGRPLRGTPFLLQPWQKFVVYNLLGFFHKGTILRRFKEAFIMLARKNGKTPFMSALAWGLGLLERKSGAEIVIVGEKLKQALQGFNFCITICDIWAKKTISASWIITKSIVSAAILRTVTYGLRRLREIVTAWTL